jgi:hypothetical protein
MTNSVYPKWKEAVEQHLGGSALNGSGSTGVFAVLVNTSVYTFSEAHQFYSDLLGVAPVDAQELIGKTFLNGIFDAQDTLWPSVQGGPTYSAVVFFIKNAGVSTTWRLFAFIDQYVTGLPFVADGSDIEITWNATGIVLP